jgi:predicted double-glycine peptidase
MKRCPVRVENKQGAPHLAGSTRHAYCNIAGFLPPTESRKHSVKKTIVLACCAALLFLAIAAQNATGPTRATAHPQQQAHVYRVHLVLRHVERIDQLDPRQYNSSADYQRWAYSTCSTAAMAEVLNAYGHHYRIADVLKVEASLGEITPALGLVEDSGIAHTLAKFGFHTSWGYQWTLDQLLRIANSGTPVIVSWPPERYPHGHLVVVTSGSSSSVSIIDSSRYNRRSLSRAQFLAWWAGFAAIAMPIQGVQL